MKTSPPETPHIVFAAALPIEADALRRAQARGFVVRTGIAMSWVLGDELGETVVSCGFAGGLREDLPTGTVLIPRTVRRPNGELIECDAALVEALVESARKWNVEPILDPLVTSDHIVNAEERSRWARQGFAGADMETGLIYSRRIAAARIILDTPRRELASDWSNARRAMLKPWNWPQALWLARTAPWAARRIAQIAAGARFDDVL